MSQYHHLTILERERIFLLHEEGVSIRKIGNDIHRSPSTISRELRRNKEKRAILLFSYPIQRKKVMFAKLGVVFLFTLSAMIVSNLLSFGIFSVSETIAPLVDSPLTAQTLIRALRVTIIMTITAAGIGIIATGIGFIKKSVPTTIVSAVLLSSLLCNIMFNTTNNVNNSDLAAILFMSVTVIAGALVAMLLMKKVTSMEVE